MQKSQVSSTNNGLLYHSCEMTSTSVIQIPTTTTRNITEDPKYTSSIGMVSWHSL